MRLIVPAEAAVPSSRLRTLVLCAALALTGAPSLSAQAVTPALLEARAVPKADTTVTLLVDGRELRSELRVPTGVGPHPVAIVIHGGCWVTKFADTRYMRPMAEGLRQQGIATFTIAYRRADEAGGGWPGTFLDVAAQAAMLRSLAPAYHLDLTRVIASGHSAGAHLALWLAAQPKLPATSPVAGRVGALPIAAVVALDGPGDLVASNTGVEKICGGNVLEQLLGATATAQPTRWREASPSAFLPLGVPQAMVRGGLDARLGPLGSAAGDMTTYAARARAAGDSSWVVNADTTSHFMMLDPERPAFATVVQAMRDALAAIKHSSGGVKR
jgi:acetyl esterase/lipase